VSGTSDFHCTVLFPSELRKAARALKAFRDAAAKGTPETNDLGVAFVQEATRALYHLMASDGSDYLMLVCEPEVAITETTKAEEASDK